MTESLEDHSGVEGQPSLSFEARVINDLFDRKDVPSNKRTRAVEKILNISYPAANRRVRGDAAWPLEDLEKVAAEYGESLATLFSEHHEQSGLKATLLIGNFHIAVRIWLASQETRSLLELVATKEINKWTVRPVSDGIPGEKIRSIQIEAISEDRHRVAIVDDDFETAQSVSEYLIEVGFDAHPFASFDALHREFEHVSYDACLLDWWIGQTTAASTIQSIRRDNSKCVIGIVTGQMESEIQTSDGIASVIAMYNVAPPFEKPTQGPILAAWLRQAISDSSTRNAEA